MRLKFKMTPLLGTTISIVFLIAFGLIGMATAEAAYPEKEVTIIIAQGLGGSTDTAIRTVAPYIQKYLKTPVLVKNMGGAGGRIGSKHAFNAAPDGHTLFASVYPAYILKEIFEGKYVPLRKFVYIYNIAGNESNGVAVKFDSPIKTFDDLVAESKKRKLFVSTTSGISNSTLGYAMVAAETGIKFKLIPYASGRKAVLSAVGGHTDLTFASLVSLRPLIRDKEVRLLTYFSKERRQEFGDVPLFKEKYPGRYYHTTTGIIAPPGTPDAVAQVLVKAIGQAVKDPKFLAEAKKRFNIDPIPSEEFFKQSSAIYKDAEQYRSIIEEFIQSVKAAKAAAKKKKKE